MMKKFVSQESEHVKIKQFSIKEWNQSNPDKRFHQTDRTDREMAI